MSKIEQYELAIRQHMKDAERDYKKSDENKRGFVVGAVLKIWEVYHDDKSINEQQFDKLIAALSSFSNGEYRDFIKDQVKAYKDGNPPIIVGY